MGASTGPTLAGFTSFIYNVVHIPPASLPTDSPAINDAYCAALEVVNCVILQVSPQQYTIAVYNLGTSNLINYAPDVTAPNPVPYMGNTTGYFAFWRDKFKILSYVPGTIQATNDETTGDSFVVPDQAQQFTLGDLEL